MEFDKSKILTVVTADQAKVGSMGYFSHYIPTLEGYVTGHIKPDKLTRVSLNTIYPFLDGHNYYSLFYPAPEPTPVFNSLKEYVLAELDWVEKNLVWVGAKVKIVASFTNPNGWEGWLNSDDFIHPSKLIDGEFVVRNVVPKGINLYRDCVRRKDGLMKDWFTVPFYVLEVVEPSKKPIIEFCKYSCEMDSFRKYANDLESQKPTYRPFANAEEFAPYRDEWFKHKESKCYDMCSSVTDYSDRGIVLCDPYSERDSLKFGFYTWVGFFEEFERENGDPCGIGEEV